MAKAIDSKVVEMKFDNKQFESGVKQSLSTLQRLKAALNFKSSSNAFSGISKSAKGLEVDLSGIAKSVAALEKRFSFLGETVRAMANKARDSLVGILGQGINFVTNSIVQGGIRRATNIENAHFQLQALLKDEKKVQEVMDDAMNAVDGTAYGFDEAAKAASMFAASGLTAGEGMQRALKGITGVAAMTNSEFSDIALIFTAVAGQGRVLGDQLMQLSARGLNAPATIAKFFNDVLGGTVQASDKVKKAISELSNGTQVAEADIRGMVSDSLISFDIFAEAMGTAFGDSAKEANKTFSGSMANMKAALARIGAEFVSPLVEQESQIIKLFNNLRDAINRVKKQIAFDKEINNTRSLSLRFTKEVLAMAKSTRLFVKHLDIESGMDVFYNVVDSGINIIKAFISVIKPIGEVIGASLGKIKVKDVIEFTGAIKDMTENLTLSEKHSGQLKKGFEGVWTVLGLVGKAVTTFLNALRPTSSEVKNTTDGFFDLIEAVGENLMAFSKWVEESNLVEKGATSIANGVKFVVNMVQRFVKTVVEFADEIDLGEMLLAGGKTIVSWAKSGIKIIKDFASSTSKSMETVKGSFKIDFSGFIANIKKLKDSVDFTAPGRKLDEFKKKVKNTSSAIKEAFGGIFSGIDLGSVLAGVGGVSIITAISKITKMFQSTTAPMDSISKVLGQVGKTLAAYQADLKADALKKTATAILILAGAIAVLSFTDTDKALKASEALSLISAVLLFGTSALINALEGAKPLDRATKTFAKSINNFTKALKWKAIGSAAKDIGVAVVLVIGAIAAAGYAYNKDKEAMTQGAKCVGIIALAIVGMIAGMSLIGQFITRGMVGFAAAAIGVALMSGSLIKIIRAISAVMDMDIPWNKQAIERRMDIFKTAIGGMAALIVAVGLANALSGKGKTAAASLFGVAVAILATLTAVKGIYGMKMPSDSELEAKNDILIGMVVGLSTLILAVGAAGRLSGGSLRAGTTLLAMCALIVTITASLLILQIIPAALLLKGAIGLSLVLSAVAKGLKGAAGMADAGAAKTVLAMCAAVGTIVAALAVMTFVPFEPMLKSAGVMGGMLLALAIDFKAISANTNEKNWLTVLAMVGILATLAGSLAVLAQFEWDSILAAGASMTSTLAALAIVFAVISKSKPNTSAIAMFVAGAVALIPMAAALSMLAGNSWDTILPATVALNATAAILTTALMVLSKANPNLSGIINFVAGAVALIPISAALKMLAGQSWSSITPGAVALNATAAVLVGALLVMSKVGISLSGVIGFVAAAVALIPISAALKMLAGQSWSSITPGAVALNATVAVLTVALAVISKAHISLTGVLGFVAATVALIPIAAAIKMLTGLSWQDVATGLVALAGGLTIIGVAGVAGTAIAPGLLALSAALIVFAAAIAAVGLGILGFAASVTAAIRLVDDLLGSMQNLPGLAQAGYNMIQGFIKGIQEGVGGLVEKVAGIGKTVIDTVKGVLGIHSPSTVFEALGINVDEGFVNGLTKGAGSISSTVGDIFGGITDQVDPTAMFGLGEDSAGNFADGLLSGESLVTDSFTQVADPSENEIATIGYTGKGQEGASNFADGLLSGEGDIESVMQQITDSTGLDLSSFMGSGEDAATNFGSGLQNGKSSIDGVTQQVTNVSGTDLTSYINLGKSAADKFIQGFKSGTNTRLTPVATQMATSLAKAVSNAVAGTNFTSSGVKAVNQLAQGIKQAAPNVTATMKTVSKSVANAIQSENEAFAIQGKKNMTAYSDGLKSNVNQAVTTIKSMSKTISSSFKNNDATFRKAGVDNMNAYNNGLKQQLKNSGKIVKQTVDSIIDNLDSTAKKFKTSGTNSGKGYVDTLEKAIKNGIGNIKRAAETIGKQYVQGVANGLTSNTGLATSAAKKLANQIDQSVKQTLDIHSPSKKGEERGKQYDQGVEKGILGNKGLVKKAAESMAADLNEVLNKKIAASVVKATATAAQMGDVTQTRQSEQFSALAQETAYWRKLLDIKKKGAEAEKYQDMDLIEFRKDILEQQKEIQEKYAEQVATERENMSQQLSLWSEVDDSLKRTRKEQAEYEAEQERKQKAEEAAANAAKKNSKSKKESSEATIKVTVKETKTLTEQLTQQTKTYNTYTKTMKSLKKKLKGTNVLDEIIKMGVDDLPLLKEINQYTDKELKAFVKAYDDRNAAVNKAADINLKDITKETKKQLEELYEVGTEGAKNYDALRDNQLFKERTYWEQLLMIKKQGAEAEKYQDMTIAEFRKSILEDTNKILEDYQKQFEQTRDNLMSQMDLFTEVEEKQVATKEELMSILESQIQAYKEYADTLASLSTRLEGTNLLDYLRDLGVGSLAELKTINSFTDEELSQYAGLYDEKLELAGAAANTKLKEIQQDTAEQLKELFGIAGDIDLTEFAAKFDGTIESIEEYMQSLQGPIKRAPEEVAENAANVIKAIATGFSANIPMLNGAAGKAAAGAVQALVASFQKESSGGAITGISNQLAASAIAGLLGIKVKFTESGTEVANAYIQGVKNKLNESKSAGNSLSKNGVAGVKQNNQQFQNAGSVQGSNYANGLKSKNGESRSNGVNLANSSLTGISSKNYDFYLYGQNAAQGFADGLLSKKATVENAAGQLANAAANKTKNTLDIHSPSKVMERLGSFAGEGFVGGLLKFVSEAILAGKDLADATMDGVSSISQVKFEGMFSDPVIRPTVDLTNVREAANEVLTMFNQAVQNTTMGAMELNANIRRERSAQNTGSDVDQRGKAQNQGDGASYSFVQNNYSPKPLSSIEIYRQTNNQFELFKRTVNQ